MKRFSTVPGTIIPGLFAFVMAAGFASGAVTVLNGAFEEDADLFATWPGYVGDGANPADIPGWTGTGGRGINPVTDGTAPFNNGTNTGAFALLQGTSTLEQTITGFSVGGLYVLGLDFNARDCCGDFPIATISLNGNVVGSSTDLFPDPGAVVPSNGAWYHADIPFEADATDVTLLISSQAATGGDATFLVDNIQIVPEPGALALCFPALFALAARRRR